MNIQSTYYLLLSNENPHIFFRVFTKAYNTHKIYFLATEFVTKWGQRKYWDTKVNESRYFLTVNQ